MAVEAVSAEALAEAEHRAIVGRGLMLSLDTARGLEAAQRYLCDGSLDSKAARVLLVDRVREAESMAEGFPYSRAKGKFFGRHGLDRAAKHKTLKKGKGAAKCENCGSLKPNADSTCANCGHDPHKLAEVTMQGVDAPKLGGVATPVKTPKTKGRGRKGTGDPQQQAKNTEFEKLHPRVRSGVGGGQFLSKGEGTDASTPHGSSRVLLLQQRLGELGLQVEKDGKFGPQTEAAVKQFQKTYGLHETGVVDPATVETMRNPPPVTAAAATAEVASMSKKGGASSRGGSGNTRSSGGTRSQRSGSGRSGVSLNQNDPVSIKAFQSRYGLKPTGKMTPETRGALAALNAQGGSSGQGSGSRGTRAASGAGKGAQSGSGLVRRGDGMRGSPDSKVEKFQSMLDDLGFDLGQGGVDGRFGGDTEAAVRKFQSRYGLRVDGIVGEQTLGMLRRIQRRRTKDAAKEGNLSIDEQPTSEPNKPSKPLPKPRKPKEPKKLAPYSSALSKKARKLKEGQYVDVGEPGNEFGTYVDYGPAAPVTPAQQLGEQPPNLRAATGWGACKNCVFWTLDLDQCRLHAWPVGKDLVCDDHYSLTPLEARHLAGYERVLKEVAAAMQEGRGSDVARMRARAEYHAGFLQEFFGRGGKSIEYDEKLHPRDRIGKWARKIGGLSKGKQVNLAPGVNVHHDPQHGYSVRASGKVVSRHGRDAHAAAAAAGRVVEERGLGRAATVSKGDRRVRPITEKQRMKGQMKFSSSLRHAALGEAADSLAKASKHEPVGKPGGPGLWHHKGLQLPAYIQHIANDIKEKRGLDTGQAIAIAIGAVKRWARGGGDVDSGTRAAATKALREWESLKARH